MIEMAKGANRRIIVFANSRKTAQAISSLIGKGAPNASAPVLLVGARRVRERESLQSNDVFKRFSPHAENETTGCGVSRRDLCRRSWR